MFGKARNGVNSVFEYNTVPSAHYKRKIKYGSKKKKNSLTTGKKWVVPRSSATLHVSLSDGRGETQKRQKGLKRPKIREGQRTQKEKRGGMKQRLPYVKWPHHNNWGRQQKKEP